MSLRASARLRTAAKRFVAASFVAASIAGGCGQSDEITMSVSPSEVAGGETVEVTLSPAAEEHAQTRGVGYLQVRGAKGGWRTRWALTTGYSADPPTYPAAEPTVTRIRKDIPFLEIGGPSVDFDTEIFLIPRVKPGTYRLVKVLDVDGEAQGFGGPPDRYTPKLASEIQVVG